MRDVQGLTNSLKLNCSINKCKENHFLCKQLYFLFLYKLDQLERQQLESRCNDVIISNKDDRKLILAWIFNTNVQIIEELLNIYDKLQEYEIKSWDGYTDSSLTKYETSNKIDMGLGWIIITEDT